MKIRWVSLLLAIILSVAAMPAFSVFAVQDFYYYVEQTYENLEISDNFNANPEGLCVSFLSEDSKIKVVGSDLSLLGKRSLAVNECDMQWNELSLADKKMYIGITVRADAEFNNELKVFNGSFVAFSILKSEGKILLKDCSETLITELEAGIRYEICCEFSRGSDSYDIYVNDYVAADNCKSGEKVYSVENVKMQVKQLAENESENLETIPISKPYIIVDNVSVYAKGKMYPQKYSTQEVGEIPEVTLTRNKESKNTRIFINATEIAMANEPVFRKNTVYIDVEQLARCLGMILSEDKANKKFTLSNEKVTAEAVIGGKILKINGNEYNVANAPERINGVIMVTPNFLCEVLNAKVWWDRATNMIVITPGSEKRDGVLRIIGGKLYMNGEPYYEIGYNKYDLFYKVLIGQTSSAEQDLKQLNEFGVKSVRVFTFSNEFSNLMYDEKAQEKYFKAMDDFFDLCEKYDIKVVACLGLGESYLLEKELVGGECVMGIENSVDLVADPQSASRKNVYKYIEKFISRYQDRKSVLMWEVANEMNLQADIGASANKHSYSLLQLAEFYGACADKIREFDRVHLITSGDSVLRDGQWNSFEDVMNGSEIRGVKDTSDETLKALGLLNEKFDVVSIHVYGLFDLSQYMLKTEKLGKVLYNGATSVANSVVNDDFYSETKLQLNFITEAGVQLSYWSNFNFDKTKVADLIKEANKTLDKKYCVNDADDENTTDAWENPSFQVVDSNLITDGMEFAVMASFKSKFIRFCILSGSMIFISLVCIVLLTREKLKRKRTEDFV